MPDWPVLTAIAFTPALGALLVLFTPARRPDLARGIAYATTTCTAGLVGYMLWHFQVGNGDFQFVENYEWIPELGISYTLGIDGISLFMVVMTALLFPIGLLAAQSLQYRVKAYMFHFLLLETAIMGIFLGLDLILFFVFWELLLVPMYFLIGGWGHERRKYAALKFFIYTMAGSAMFLIAILTLAFLHQGDTGVLTFDFRTLMEWNGLARSTETWLFLGFFISFAIKSPLVPFHTWMPDVHTEAPTFGSVILAGVLLKMGAYGFLRFSFSLFPRAAVDLAPLLLTLSVIGIIYGALVASVQKDLKRLVAYSSVAHMGFIILGIFSLTTIGLDGATFNMVSHPLTTGSLFLLIGFLYERRHTRQISELKGIWNVAPVFTAMFLIATLAGIGVPGFSGFIGEFLALLGTFLANRPYAIVAAVGVIFAAVYMLWAFRRVFTEEPDDANRHFPDLSVREIVVVAPLLALSLFLGVYPRPVLDRVEPTAEVVIQHLEDRTDYSEPDANVDIVEDEERDLTEEHDANGSGEETE